MMIDPRISVHEVCFPAAMDLDSILAWSGDNDVRQIGLFSLRRGGDWDKAVASAAKSDVRIAYLSHASMFQLADPSSWPASTEELIRTIDAAKAMGAGYVYGTTGPAGGLEFDEATEALARAIIPVRSHAEANGIRLMTETTQSNFCFTHYVHTFQDTLDVAQCVGIGVCLDLWPTWNERDIRQRILGAAGRIELIQVADHIPRNTTPTRDVIGTGVIPVERLLGAAFRAGYDGLVDLELFGRPDETALADTLASARTLTDILERIRADT